MREHLAADQVEWACIFNDFLKQLIKYEDMEFVLISDVAESEYIKSFQNKGIKVYTQGKRFIKVLECIHISHL